MSTVIDVLATAERHWLLGVLLFLCGTVALIGVVEAIQRWRGRT